MPYPNMHVAEVKPSSEFDRFRRVRGGRLVGLAPKVEAPKTVIVSWGHLRGRGPDAWAIHELLFPRGNWTANQARKWLAKNRLKLDVAEATGQANQGGRGERMAVEDLTSREWAAAMGEGRYVGPDDPRLPDHVRDERDEDARSIWVQSYNAALDHCRARGGNDCEAHAQDVADGRMKTHKREKAGAEKAAEVGGGESVALVESTDGDGDAPETVEIEMDIFKAGDYGRKGRYSRDDIRAMADDYAPAYHEAPVKVDHVDEGPAYGWIRELRQSESDPDMLVARAVVVPELAEKIRKGQFRKRSVELYFDFPATGRPHVRGVAFLGAGVPEVKGLGDVKLLETADGGEPEWGRIEFEQDGGVAEGEVARMANEKPMRTEDGVRYPAEAYAYVPDPQKPSTWKLRVWETPEKKVTRAQLGRAAAALSPGGYRGRRVQIPRGDLAKVKARLRAEYRKLGVKDAEMPRWVKQSEAEQRALCAEVVTLQEASADAPRVWPVQIIAAGFNKKRDRYYPWETLREAAERGLFEGVDQYMSDRRHRQSKDEEPSALVAVLKNVRADDATQTLRGESHVVCDDLQRKLENLREIGELGRMRQSIVAIGRGFPAVIDGVKTVLVEAIERVRAVDYVMSDGAGGYVLAETAATPDPWDVDLIDLAALRERRPDLVEAVAAEVRERTNEEVKQMAEATEELQAELEAVAKERDDLRAKFEAAEKRLAELTAEQARAKVAATCDELLAKASLPEPIRARVKEAFASAEPTDDLADKIREEIERWRRDLAAIGVKAVAGMGEGEPARAEAEEGRAKLAETLKRRFRRQNPAASDAEIERMVAHALEL